ncbi:MAG: right-handed parallel beta-helix repeat-containing protein, partial [Phycisphaeraceae bacterium]|nr:right-handed parallel beta-helix repeat-containing protein [Phycisphaeraceae bacterium]
MLTLLVLCVFLAAAGRASAQTIIYVNAAAAPGGNGQSWATAYQDVVAALLAAELVPPQSRNFEIWVAQGVYRPNNPLARRNTPDPRSACFKLLNGVAIYGGFAGGEIRRSQRNWLTNQTVLSGDLAGNDSQADFDWTNHGDNVYSVVWARSNDRTAILDGFVITGGNSVEDGSFGLPPGVTASEVPYVGQGSGIFAYHGPFGAPPVDGPSIRNCWITRNVAHDCAGYDAVRSGGELLNCRLTLNEAINQGGGLFLDGSAGTHLIAGCLIADNRATRDSGMSIYGIQNQIVNCTIVRNHNTDPSSQAVRIARPCQMENCIIFYNTPGPVQVRANDVVNTSIRNCAVEGGLGGIVTIGQTSSIYSLVPGFVNPYGTDGVPGSDDDDWRLQANSPYVDLGNNAVVPAGMLFDLDRRLRIFDFALDDIPVVDLGAYETGSPILTDRLYVRAAATGSGESWASPLSSLQEAITIATVLGEDQVSEIWVAAGTYTPSPPIGQGGSRSASFQLRNGLV